MTRAEAIALLIAVAMNARPKDPTLIENYIRNVDEAFHTVGITTEELNEAVNLLPHLEAQTRLQEFLDISKN